MLPDELRERKEDTSLLRKWEKEVPDKVLKEGKPYNISV